VTVFYHCFIAYQSLMNWGIIFAANIEIMTSMAACLNPDAIDSSLIFPATIPIIKLWKIAEVTKMLVIWLAAFVAVALAAPLIVVNPNPEVRPVIITVVATSSNAAK
jgi:hypothetical protein